MTQKYDLTIDAIQHQLPGETYGKYCDRLEDVVNQVVNAQDNSSSGIELLAFVLMEAPSDFDWGSVNPPTNRARSFLSKQTSEVKTLFREKAGVLPRARPDRIEFLLAA